MSDPRTRLREALLPACATTQTYTATDGHPSLKVLSPGEVADAVLAALSEHRDDVLAVLGMVASSVNTCTGLAATWCPVHGDCTCERREDGEVQFTDLGGCPLHSIRSRHAVADPTTCPHCNGTGKVVESGSSDAGAQPEGET